MLLLIRLGAAMVPAFFLAGAIAFPLVEPFYLTRVIVTGGIAALMYGVESVVRMGHVETCGFLSGNCSQHSVRAIAFVIWAALFGLWSMRSATARCRAATAEHGGEAGSSSLPELALALVAGLVVLVWAGTVWRAAPEPRTAARAPATPTSRLAPTPAHDPAAPHGLTFGLMQAKAPAAGTMVVLGCHAQPAPADQPHRDSCNPYEGDTSCRATLPIACLRPADVQQLAATSPVAGSSLTLAESGSERCAAELGAGWRMATFHDGMGAEIPGEHVRGLRPATRYWVAIGDEPGNCWDRR